MWPSPYLDAFGEEVWLSVVLKAISSFRVYNMGDVKQRIIVLKVTMYPDFL